MATITTDHTTLNNLDRRRMLDRYTLTDERFQRVDDYGNVSRPALDISTSHDKERKRYRTSINRVTVDSVVVRWVLELRGEDPCPIADTASTPVARYSEKGLREEHERTLGMIAALSPAEYEELLLWASRAK